MLVKEMADNQEVKTKEQQILAAAEQEFLTKGYDGARTTAIAKVAGVTHAMLHYYFRTKEQLFERIVDEKFATMSRSMFAIMGDPKLPIVERIIGEWQPISTLWQRIRCYRDS